MRIREKTHWISFAVGLAVMCIPIFGFFQERVFSYSKYGVSSFVYLRENPKEYWALMVISTSIALFFLLLSKFSLPAAERFLQRNRWQKQMHKSKVLPRTSFVATLLLSCLFFGAVAWYVL